MKNKGYTLFELMVASSIGVVFLLVIGFFIFFGFYGAKLVSTISTDGVKSVVERVWEGERR